MMTGGSLIGKPDVERVYPIIYDYPRLSHGGFWIPRLLVILLSFASSFHERNLWANFGVLLVNHLEGNYIFLYIYIHLLT